MVEPLVVEVPPATSPSVCHLGWSSSPTGDHEAIGGGDRDVGSATVGPVVRLVVGPQGGSQARPSSAVAPRPPPDCCMAPWAGHPAGGVARHDGGGGEATTGAPVIEAGAMPRPDVSALQPPARRFPARALAHGGPTASGRHVGRMWRSVRRFALCSARRPRARRLAGWRRSWPVPSSGLARAGTADMIAAVIGDMVSEMPLTRANTRAARRVRGADVEPGEEQEAGGERHTPAATVAAGAGSEPLSRGVAATR